MEEEEEKEEKDHPLPKGMKGGLLFCVGVSIHV